MDRTALDWLFSTAPQALAALVGLIFTGVAFILATIEKEEDRDSTRESICYEMKREIHIYMKWLFLLAGISIVFDLGIIIFNPIEEDYVFSIEGCLEPYLIFAGMIFLLNIFTLCFSLWFIIRVADPNYFKNTIKRLSKDADEGTIETKDFIMEYINLEKALRALPLNVSSSVQKPVTIPQILGELKYRKLLSVTEIHNMFYLNRLRNLIVHGAEINHVKNQTYQDVKRLTHVISELKNRL